jgi:hypothetical protein
LTTDLIGSYNTFSFEGIGDFHLVNEFVDPVNSTTKHINLAIVEKTNGDIIEMDVNLINDHLPPEGEFYQYKLNCLKLTNPAGRIIYNCNTLRLLDSDGNIIRPDETTGNETYAQRFSAKTQFSLLIARIFQINYTSSVKVEIKGGITIIDRANPNNHVTSTQAGWHEFLGAWQPLNIPTEEKAKITPFLVASFDYIKAIEGRFAGRCTFLINNKTTLGLGTVSSDLFIENSFQFHYIPQNSNIPSAAIGVSTGTYLNSFEIQSGLNFTVTKSLLKGKMKIGFNWKLPLGSNLLMSNFDNDLLNEFVGDSRNSHVRPTSYGGRHLGNFTFIQEESRNIQTRFNSYYTLTLSYNLWDKKRK